MNTRVELDWAGPYGTFWGTVCLTVGAYAVASAGYAAGLEPWWAALAGLGGAWAELCIGAVRGLSPAGRVYRTGCMVAGGGWGWWALASSPWTVQAAAALAIGAAVAGLLATVYAHHRRPEPPPGVEPARPKAGSLDQDGRAWERRLARICSIGRITEQGLVGGAAVRGIERWSTGAGRTIDVDLPGGKTWRDVANHADALASDLRLPTGCGVEVSAGINRGACLIRVSERDNLAEDQPYPGDYGPQTVNAPITIGVHRDSSPAQIELRQPSTMVIGQKGSGKTNQLHVLIGEMGRCVDTLIWCIDMGGGGVALPWLWPWQEGQVDRPVVDWVAADPAEAQLMLEAALRIARHRKVAYTSRKRAANTDLLPIDATVPEILIVVDEGAEVTSWRSKLGQIADQLTSLVQIARDSAVNVIYSGLRGTGDTIGRDTSTQMGNRLALRMQDETEYGVVLGWAGRISAEEIAYPGCGFLATIEQPSPRPYRAYRLLPNQIAQISVAVAGQRPVLDGPSAQAAGDSYANRWNRAGALLEAGTAKPPNRQEDEVHDDGHVLPPAKDTEQVLREAAEANRQLREAVAEHRGEVFDPEVDEQFREIVADTVVWSDPSTWPTADSSAAGRARLVEVVDLAGSGGIMFSALQERLAADGFTPSRSTLYTWLAMEKRAGTIVQPDGDKSPYIAARFRQAG